MSMVQLRNKTEKIIIDVRDEKDALKGNFLKEVPLKNPFKNFQKESSLKDTVR